MTQIISQRAHEISDIRESIRAICVFFNLFFRREFIFNQS